MHHYVNYMHNYVNYLQYQAEVSLLYAIQLNII